MNMIIRKTESHKEGYVVYKIVKQSKLGGQFFRITQVFTLPKQF
jgi:hypothetical protein